MVVEAGPCIVVVEVMVVVFVTGTVSAEFVPLVAPPGAGAFMMT